MCRSITCIILTAVNVVLLLCGLALLIAGALLKWNKQLLRRLIDTALQKANFDMSSTDGQVVDQALERIQEMSGPIGVVLLIMGVVLCCLAVLAFIGLCCNIKLIMIIYAALIAAVFLAHLLLIIIYFANKQVLMKYVDKGFLILIQNYVSIQSQEPESVALALAMPAMKCCGYNSGDDFKMQGSRFSGSDGYQNVTYNDMAYPLPCCKPERIGPNNCPQSFTEENSYIRVGCKTKIEPLIDMVLKYSIIALIVEAAVLAVTIVHICLS